MTESTPRNHERPTATLANGSDHRVTLTDWVVVLMLLLAASGIPVWIGAADNMGDMVSDPRAQIVWVLVYLVVGWRLLAHLRQTRATLRHAKLPLVVTAIALASSFWSVDPSLTLRRSIALTGTTLAGIYLAMKYPLEFQVRLLARALALAVALSFFVGIFLPDVGTMKDFAGAWRGIFNHKNSLGHMMVLSCGVFLIARKYSRRNKVVLLVLAVLSLLLVFLSRSATGVVLVGIFAVLAPLHKRFAAGARITKSRVLVFLLFLGTITWIVFDNIKTILDMLGRDATLTGRLRIWAVAALAIIKRPFLGYGYDAFWTTSGTQLAGKVIRFPAAHAHNGYLQAIVDIGLVGFLAFMVMYGITLVRAFRLSLHSEVAYRTWPLFFLIYGLIYNITLPGFLARNELFWMMLVATFCSLEGMRVKKPSPKPQRHAVRFSRYAIPHAADHL
ncbi:MAG: O-antigen ligase family protein [Acidobacteriaceae bacterium]